MLTAAGFRPAQSAEEWAAPYIYTYDLEDLKVQARLKDSVIGIDASYYLDLRLNKTSHEPLLHALGGFPYSLKKILDDDMQFFKSYNIKPIFVFDGLDFRNKEQPSSRSSANRKAHDDGWKHYLDENPDQTVANFSRAGKRHHLSASTGAELRSPLACPVETLHKYLQKLLADFQITWMVAPYSAVAQVRLRVLANVKAANSGYSCTTSRTSKTRFIWNSSWARSTVFFSTSRSLWSTLT